MRKLFRFWFTADEPVDRRTYLAHGVALSALKYVVDAALVWWFAHVAWTPFDYIAAGISLRQSKLASISGIQGAVLALWTAPFFWIGLTLSARRARDAGITPWVAQLFFVPFLNYAFIALMSVAPTRPEEVAGRSTEPLPADRKFSRTLRAVGLGAAAGIGLVLVGLGLLDSYGASLFFGAPFVLGAVSAYSYNRSHSATATETARIVLLTLAVVALAIMTFAVEGLICVVMAFPFAYLISLMGSSFGRWIARHTPGTPVQAALGLLLLPASAPLLDSRDAHQLHEVRSAIEIDAPALIVWRSVVSFPPMAAPRDLLFRVGISYPIGARIVGEGVGAVRYCEFSTGPFEEPITTWEPGRRLSFDVVRSPPPMRELSPYDISPPHLDGYFAAKRGEFRLIALPGGRTRLEGSTWYDLRMGPERYWALFADAIVGRIHERVLTHIKRNAEATAAN